jgi:hypothetical protein
LESFVDPFQHRERRPGAPKLVGGVPRPDARMLEAAWGLLADTKDDRIRFLIPDGLIAFLDEMAARSGPDEPLAPSMAQADKAVAAGGRTGPPIPPDAKKRLLIAKDAAGYIALAVQTLAKMRVRGDSPPFYKVARQVMYDRADLDVWLAERRRRSTSDAGIPDRQE